MKLKKTTSVLLLLLMTFTVMAQTFTDSNLPIVVIETDGGINIPDEPKVPGTMKIIWHQDGLQDLLQHHAEGSQAGAVCHSGGNAQGHHFLQSHLAP